MKKLLRGVVGVVLALMTMPLFAGTLTDYSAKISNPAILEKLDSVINVVSRQNEAFHIKLLTAIDKIYMNNMSNETTVAILLYLKTGIQNQTSVYADKTIVQTAIDTKMFPTLVAAVQAAGLVDALSAKGSLTVFAPTEDAFADLLKTLDMTAAELLANKDLLTTVLTYHVLAGDVRASDVLGLKNMTNVQTLQGENITVSNETSVMINNANLVQADIITKNGVIHVIDAVLLPPTLLASLGITIEVADEGVKKNIAQTAIDSEMFPTLVAALQAADLVDAVANTQNITVFAPTEKAFADLLISLNMTAAQLLADKALLTKVLTYHVVPGVYAAADVMALTKTTNFATLQGSNVAVSANGGKYYVNKSLIIQTDIMASNGVIHVIDKVLVPQN